MNDQRIAFDMAVHGGFRTVAVYPENRRQAFGIIVTQIGKPAVIVNRCRRKRLLALTPVVAVIVPAGFVSTLAAAQDGSGGLRAIRDADCLGVGLPVGVSAHDSRAESRYPADQGADQTP